MRTFTITLNLTEIWTLNAMRNKLSKEEKKSKTIDGQASIEILNKILKAVAEAEKIKTPPAP